MTVGLLPDRDIEIASELTAWERRQVDDLAAALEDADARGLVPSTAARRARITLDDARRLLPWMAEHHLAHTTGRGSRTHYYPGRG